jgi:hypothetical protein
VAEGIENPMIAMNRKFDIRQWVLVETADRSRSGSTTRLLPALLR